MTRAQANTTPSDGNTGIFKLARRDLPALQAAASELGQACLNVNLERARNVPGFIRAVSRDLSFPDWFGGNLDALADCLNDLSWLSAPGYLLVLEHIGPWREQAADDVEAVIEILQDAAARWAGDGVPFWAMLPLPSHELAAVEGTDDD